MSDAVDIDIRYGEDSRDAADRTLIATHTFIAAISEGDKTIPVKLTVKERTSGDSLYSNLVLERIDKINEEVITSANTPGENSINGGHAHTDLTSSKKEEVITSTGKLRSISRSIGTVNADLTSSEISIAELLSKVKDARTRKYIPPQFYGKPPCCSRLPQDAT